MAARADPVRGRSGRPLKVCRCKDNHPLEGLESRLPCGQLVKEVPIIIRRAIEIVFARRLAVSFSSAQDWKATHWRVSGPMAEILLSDSRVMAGIEDAVSAYRNCWRIIAHD